MRARGKAQAEGTASLSGVSLTRAPPPPSGAPSPELHAGLLVTALASLLSACSAPPPAAVGSAETTALCPRCSTVASTGTLARTSLDECSGAAASETYPDVLYLHNDSGDDARFFAVSLDGTPRGEFDVEGVRAIDWEDVARGPCPDSKKRCLFFADIGDNDKQRTSYAIYRVEEPSELDLGRRAVTAEAIPFAYPDGSHNAETLLVHPITGVITIVTKVKKGSSHIYELTEALTPGEPATPRRVGKIAPPTGSPLFTGGSVRPDGRGVLLRTYTNVFFYPMTPGESVATALTRPPCPMPVADEDKGEAITWLAGGWDYVTLSEGISSKISRVSCAPP